MDTETRIAISNIDRDPDAEEKRGENEMKKKEETDEATKKESAIETSPSQTKGMSRERNLVSRCRRRRGGERERKKREFPPRFSTGHDMHSVT